MNKFKHFSLFKKFCSYIKPYTNEKSTIDRNNSVIKKILKDEENILSFREFRFIPEIYNVLDRLNVNAPTSIQSVAIPKIMEKKNVFFSSQTGTGKTFTYLLPLLNELKEMELSAGKRLTLEKRPRALIIVPTRELAQQVEEVCKLFIYDIPLVIESFYVGRDFTKERKASEKGIDIVITTPERFSNHWKKHNIHSTKLTHVVIDELDTLLDAGNEEFIKNISIYSDKQIVIASATMTNNIETFLDKMFQDNKLNFVKLIDKSTNHNLSNVKHEFLHVTDFDKYPSLLKLLNDNIKLIKQNFSIIIFVNSIACARKTELLLMENNFSTACLHGDIPPNRRKIELEKFKKRSAKILICTDLISRGLDWPFVYLVINFDFPKTLADYVHRAGRTGRMGTHGIVVSFYRNFNLNIIEKIKQSHHMNLPLRIDYSMFSRRTSENAKFQKNIKKRITPSINATSIDINKKFTKAEVSKIRVLQRRKTLFDKFKKGKEENQKKLIQRIKRANSLKISKRDKNRNKK